MVMLLGSLAHNVLVWAQGWSAATASLMRHYGPLRLVRDVLHISGFLFLDALGARPSDWAQSGCPVGSCFTQLFPNARRSCACRHVFNQNLGLKLIRLFSPQSPKR
jgi:hypothetical protein